jgi:hypothetical protein
MLEQAQAGVFGIHVVDREDVHTGLFHVLGLLPWETFMQGLGVGW